MKIKSLLNRETVSYLLSGAFTTVVDTAVFFLSYNMLHIKSEISVIISWAFAVAFAYVTNKVWVFKSETDTLSGIAKEISAFISARIFSLVFAIVFMFVCEKIFEVFITQDEIFEWCVFASKVASNVFVVIMNYFFSKFFIFGNKK